MPLSLILPTQGNPIALKRTLESTKGIVDEIILGSVCIFKSDLEIIKTYQSEYNLKILELPFDYIFHMGFSNTLNYLSYHAKNDLVIYLNVGEVIEKGKDEILSKISDEYNCYYIDHSQEKHRWWRCFNRKEIKWGGMIHEESISRNGEHKPYHKPLFTFADTDKDMDDKFKAIVYNDVKEICYFRLLCNIVEYPDMLEATNSGWIEFAKGTYDSMQERLAKKGDRYKAFQMGDLHLYLLDIFTNPEFEKDRYESSSLIEFQGDKKFLL